MNRSLASFTALAALALSFDARANTPNLCAPIAYGVPSRPGPPDWLDGLPTSSTALDDPRWMGAASHDYGFGAAHPPLLTRAVWGADGGQSYVYLSFQLTVGVMSTSGNTSTGGKDFFIGIKPPLPGPVQGTTSPMENSYILSFHLAAVNHSSLPVPVLHPTMCPDGTSWESCTGQTGTDSDTWALWVDRGNVSNPTQVDCGAAGTGDIEFDRKSNFLPPSGQTTPTPSTVWMSTGVSFWKLSQTSSDETWAVQLRIPVSSAATDVWNGVEEGTGFFYEVSDETDTETTTSTGNTGGTAYIPGISGWWPHNLAHHLCYRYQNALSEALYHQDLGATAGNWGVLSRVGGGAPPTTTACDSGVSISPSDIGVIVNPNLSTVDWVNDPLSTTFEGYDPANTPASNYLVARAHLNISTGDTITSMHGPLAARFRLANWGAQPYDWNTGAWTDTGQWTDVPGASLVCEAGATPNCTDATFSTVATAPSTPPPTTLAMHSEWTLSADERCEYQTNPSECSDCDLVAGGCEAPNTSTSPNCGTKSSATGSSGTCQPKHWTHECMLVELSDQGNASTAPGDMEFQVSSAYENMNFGSMSQYSEPATISTKGLPDVVGVPYHDLLLVVMPHNMPATVPAGSTGVDLIRAGAARVAAAQRQPYADDYQRLQDTARQQIAGSFDRSPLFGGKQEVFGKSPIRPNVGLLGATTDDGRPTLHGLPDASLELPAPQVNDPVLSLMPNRDLAANLVLQEFANAPESTSPDALTRSLVQTFGPATASDIVPSLDVYVYYASTSKSGAPSTLRPIYFPMTSFVVFLHHDSSDAVKGLWWTIDGAKQIGPNVFSVQIPNDQDVKVQVMASTDGPVANIPPPPCGCCPGRQCSPRTALANSAPVFVAGVFAFGRRRRRRRT